MLDQLLGKVLFDRIDGRLFSLVQVDFTVNNFFQHVSCVQYLAITSGVFVFRFYLAMLVKFTRSTVFNEGHTKQFPNGSSLFHISDKALPNKFADIVRKVAPLRLSELKRVEFAHFSSRYFFIRAISIAFGYQKVQYCTNAVNICLSCYLAVLILGGNNLGSQEDPVRAADVSLYAHGLRYVKELYDGDVCQVHLYVGFEEFETFAYYNILRTQILVDESIVVHLFELCQ